MLCLEDIFAIEHFTKSFLILLISVVTTIIECIFLITQWSAFFYSSSYSNPIYLAIDRVNRAYSLQPEIRADFQMSCMLT